MKMLLCHLLLVLLLPQQRAEDLLSTACFMLEESSHLHPRAEFSAQGSSAPSRPALTRRRAVPAWLGGFSFIAGVSCSRNGGDRPAPAGVTPLSPALLQGDPQDVEELHPLASCYHKSFPAQIFWIWPPSTNLRAPLLVEASLPHGAPHPGLRLLLGISALADAPSCPPRSLREDPPAAEWQEVEEEEDHSQEEDPKPLLQRVLQL